MRTEFEVIIERKDGKQFRYVYQKQISHDSILSLKEAIDRAHYEYEKEHRGVMISALRTKREDK